jgi:hypothetical protein
MMTMKELSRRIETVLPDSNSYCLEATFWRHTFPGEKPYVEVSFQFFHPLTKKRICGTNTGQIWRKISRWIKAEPLETVKGPHQIDELSDALLEVAP